MKDIIFKKYGQCWEVILAFLEWVDNAFSIAFSSTMQQNSKNILVLDKKDKFFFFVALFDLLFSLNMNLTMKNAWETLKNLFVFVKKIYFWAS